MQHRAARQDLEAFRYVGTPDDLQVFRRAARNAAASDALDAAVKIAFLSAFMTASQDARYCA
jgi:hypothetical protein